MDDDGLVPQAVLDAIARVAAWKLRSGVDPREHTQLVSTNDDSRFGEGEAVDVEVISGHRDTSYTDCPGDALQEALPAIRAEAARLRAEVPGCRVVRLGRLRYAAVATRDFHAQHFADGVGSGTLAEAPIVAFDRNDSLQHDFVRRVTRRHLAPPVTYLPSVREFDRAIRVGMGWGLLPESDVAAELVSRARAGDLVLTLGAGDVTDVGPRVLALLGDGRDGPGDA